jgi:hypothetical protein
MVVAPAFSSFAKIPARGNSSDDLCGTRKFRQEACIYRGSRRSLATANTSAGVARPAECGMTMSHSDSRSTSIMYMYSPVRAAAGRYVHA